MFPTSRIKRHNLAVYLTRLHTPAIDVTTLMESCAVGWKLSCTNGMVDVSGTAMFEARMVFGEGPQPPEKNISAGDLVQFALHCAWVAFYPMVTSMACYIQSRHMQCGTPFWSALHGAVAWLISTPAIITDLFTIGRPDLSDMARRMYMSWLTLARCPANIETGIKLLSSTPWEFTTGTRPFNTLIEWMDRCAVQAIVPSHKVPAGGRLIKINNCNAVMIADRDHVLLSMMFLFSTETRWCDGVPDEAPAVFRKLEATHPYLFQRLEKTGGAPPSPFDDLLYLTEECRDHMLDENTP
jgi:hypothetical protein